jgi:tetratricopeptide (TPR) repeat protein
MMRNMISLARRGSQAGPLAVSLMLWMACSPDPAKQKLAYLRSGTQYYDHGKYREAMIEFRNAAQIDPRSAEAHYRLARTYLALGQADAGYRELNETITLDPAHRDAELELAALLTARRQYGQGRTLAQKVLRENPENLRAHVILSETYTATGDTAKAILELQKTIELDPRKVETYAALGAVYRSAGQSSEAEASYQRGVQVNPSSAAAHIALGQFYFSDGRVAEAEREMLAASSLDPHAVLPRLALGRIYTLTGKLPEAGKSYSELRAIAPDDPRAYQALGIFYASTGLKEKAVAEFRSVLSRKPKDRAVRAMLVHTLIDLKRIQEAAAVNQSANQNEPSTVLASGRILLAEGKYEAAEAAFQRAVKMDPQSAPGYYLLGTAQKLLSLPESAKSSFAHALQLSPRMVQAQAALASLEIRGGHNNDALRLAEDAVAANPDWPEANLAHAQALLARGELHEGEKALEKVLTTAPDSLPALAMLMKVSVAQAKTAALVQRISGLVQQNRQNAGLQFLLAVGYFSLKDVEKAEGSAREAIKLDPQTPGAYTLLAFIDFSKGASEAGKADLRKAIAAHPRTLTNYMALARQYEQEGNWEEAKKLCERAHALDPAAPLVTDELAFLYLEHGGDINVALSLAEDARQRMPDSATTADALGWAYYRFGAADLAVKQLRDATQKRSDNPMYLYHLGMAYMAAHRSDLARQNLEAALQKGAGSSYAGSVREALTKLSTKSDR